MGKLLFIYNKKNIILKWKFWNLSTKLRRNGSILLRRSSSVLRFWQIKLFFKTGFWFVVYAYLCLFIKHPTFIDGFRNRVALFYYTDQQCSLLILFILFIKCYLGRQAWKGLDYTWGILTLLTYWRYWQTLVYIQQEK